jgi:hypothetical protein
VDKGGTELKDITKGEKDGKEMNKKPEERTCRQICRSAELSADRSDIRAWRTSGHDRTHSCGSEPKGEGARAWARQASKGVLSTATPDLVPRHADRLSLTQGCTGFDTRLGASRVLWTNTTPTTCLTDKQPLPRVLQTTPTTCLTDKHNPYHVSYKHNPYHVLRTNTTPTTCLTNTTPTTCLTNTTPTTCLTDKHNPYHVSYGQTRPLPRVLRTNTTPTTCLTYKNDH